MAVNFYKFAAAIMELLEPEKYNFSSRAKLSAQPNEIAPEAAAVNQISETEILPVAAAGDVPASSQIAAKLETAAVEIVAARLTETIANASEEKVQQIAQIIESVTIENKQENKDFAATAAPNIIEKIEDESAKNQAEGHTTDAASLVNATIKTLAAEKVQEIHQTVQSAAADDAATSVSTDEAKLISAQTAAVVNDLTDKLQETAEIIKETGVSPITAEIAKPAAGVVFLTVAKDLTEKISAEPVKPLAEKTIAESVEPVDFWDLFPEFDLAELKYFSAVSYLYDYMSSRAILDFLNPEIDLVDRLFVMTNVSQAANSQSATEAQFAHEAQRSTNEQNDQIRDREHEDRNSKARLQQEWQQRQRIDRQKFEERMYALGKDVST